MRLCDLGALSVELDGAQLSPGGKRPATLLALLLIHANQRVSVESAIDAIWGDRASSGSASTLESHVWRLRRLLEPDRGPREPSTVLINQAGGYRLLVAPEQVDSLQFSQFADDVDGFMSTDQPDRALRRSEEALRLWRGRPFGQMADEGWAASAVARLEEQRQQIQERRIDALLASGQPERAAVDVQPLIAEMPFRERFRRQQMLALYRSGRAEAALRAFQDARTVLLEEIGLEPGAELQELQRRILDQDPGLDLVRQASREAPIEVHLPARTSDIIGRERELADIPQALGSRRLVTLTGPAGTGKTRLAVELGARTATGLFPDGVWFADLAPIAEPELIVTALMSTMGLQPPTGGGALAAVQSHVRGRKMLLILDNCEHLLPELADIAAALVAQGGELTVLATCREPLAVAGEQVWPVQPLPIRPAETAPGCAAAEGPDALSPAAELFLRRAREAAPLRLAGMAEDAARAAAGTIVAAIDGLPLAIELAAARAQTYTLDEIAAQVTADPSRLARLSARDGDHRQSLRAALDWSDRLLTDRERQFHRELSVLPGPFSAAAAAGVATGGMAAGGVAAGGMAAGADGSADAELEPADLLPVLVNRSLLVAESPARDGGPSQFRQLAIIRAHAARGLEGDRRTEELLDRRDAWVRRLVDTRPRFGSSGESAWFAALDDDYATVRATLERGLVGRPAPGSAALGVAVASRISPYLYYRSRIAEGGQWLSAATAAIAGGLRLEPADDALAALAMASVHSLRGRIDLAEPLFDRALSLAPSVPADRLAELGHRLGNLATAVWSTDDMPLMRSVFEAMAGIALRCDDPSLPVFADSVECLVDLPVIDLQDSAERAERAYAAAIEQDHTYAAWTAAGARSVVALMLREPRAGMLWSDRIIDAHWRLGTRQGGWYLETRANFACLAGDYPQAVALYAAARAHNRRGGILWPRRAVTTELRQQAERELTEDAVVRARRLGERWSLADIVALPT